MRRIPEAVHYVENDGDAQPMSLIDECLQIVGPAVLVVVDGVRIGGVIRVGLNAIELADWDQFDRVETEALNMRQLLNRALESSRVGGRGVVRSHVHFVDDECIQTVPSSGSRMRPRICLRIVGDGIASDPAGLVDQSCIRVTKVSGLPFRGDDVLILLADRGAGYVGGPIHIPHTARRLLTKRSAAPIVEYS